eukprot:CAMPEP_0184680924 /NCGR_PEP_ID=MMETSP0312-20130426/3849_1 /TAXON_ID=31354 /ORGANISM="Compsopogon coeruleus, Strain SAG 36.94" /LENGTH=90 /DNA_ID=CAMNT_0027131385 /DNA_START=21 /DNA_END=289 /DNA_ORIENTATION=-
MSSKLHSGLDHILGLGKERCYSTADEACRKVDHHRTGFHGAVFGLTGVKSENLRQPVTHAKVNKEVKGGVWSIPKNGGYETREQTPQSLL